MSVFPRVSTTEMEVTSIRLERQLKERLKQLSGRQGYQALIREILWDYVQQQTTPVHCSSSRRDRPNIRARIPAIAQQEERCALTGATIPAEEEMFLGLTLQGELVPLSRQSCIM